MIYYGLVDETKDIREAILEILDIPRLTRSVIENAIANFLEQNEIKVKGCRGKCWSAQPTFNWKNSV